jgi:hypothetical protein
MSANLAIDPVSCRTGKITIGDPKLFRTTVNFTVEENSTWKVQTLVNWRMLLVMNSKIS